MLAYIFIFKLFPSLNEMSNETDAKVGENSDGSYSTPYQTLILYNPESYFETSVAVLSEKANCVSIYSDTISQEHPSPELLIFTPHFEREELLKFLERYNYIRIFCYEPTDKYDTDGKIFDNRVELIAIDTLYDHITVKNGITSIFLLENIICTTFPGYKSDLNDVSCQTGTFLIQAINYNNYKFADKIDELSTSFKGIDIANELISEGKAISKIYKRILDGRVFKGLHFVIPDVNLTAFAVSVEDDLYNLINIQTLCDIVNDSAYILFYNMENHVCDNSIILGWRLILMARKPDAPSSLSILEKYSLDNASTGNNIIATTWATAHTARDLMPFIFPKKID